MEINYKIELIEMFNRCYEFADKTTHNLAYYGYDEDAKQVILDVMNECYGATSFAVQFLNNNGYHVEANEILNLWNNGWSDNFSSLYKEYNRG